MAVLNSILRLTPDTTFNSTTARVPYVSDGASALGFPALGANTSVTFRVTFDAAVSNVDPTDFTLNAEAAAAGGAIETVVAADTTNTIFNVQVVGLGNFDGELTLSISKLISI